MLKNLFILSFISLASLGFPKALSAKTLLSLDEQYQFLKSIDAICGDSWCEGESDWSFDKITCDEDEGCVLTLTMLPYPFSDEVSLASRTLTCELPTFRTKLTILEENERGTRHTPEIFEAIDGCIYDLLDKYGPMYVPRPSACPSLFNDLKRPLTVRIRNELEGLDAALWSVTRIVRDFVRELPEGDGSCELSAYPFYRDEAFCQEEGLNTICFLPTTRDYFRVEHDLMKKEASVTLVEKLPLTQSSQNLR